MAPKITYFNFRGLAELPRMLCKYGGIDFEDIRVTNEEWAELKPNTPFGTLPTYEENDKVCGQSLAIARYLAKKVKLVGDTDWDNLAIDSIVDTLTDLRLKVAQLHYENDPERKERLKETLLNETMPFYLERLDKIAAENNGFMAAKKLTWADFYLANCLDMYKWLVGEETISKYTNLLAVKQKVFNIAAIKNWIAERPVTEF